MTEDWKWYSIIVYKQNDKICSKKCLTECEHIEFLLEITFDQTSQKEYKLHWFYGDNNPHFSPWPVHS